MKGTFIKSTKQLPEWFKLENYRKAEFFEAPEWHDELMSRFALRQGILRYLNDSIGSSRRWALIKRDGLLFYSANISSFNSTNRKSLFLCYITD